MKLEDLTADSFTPHTDSVFHATVGDGPPFDLTLVEVTEVQQPGDARRQFSLVFRGGPQTPPPQGIYRLDHADLGALEIFVVPIGPDAEGQRYEAIFT